MKFLAAFGVGVQGYWRGVRWFFQNPAMLLLLLIPLFFALAAFGAGMWAFWSYGSQWLTSLLMHWFMAWQDEWQWQVLYWLVKSLMWFSVLLLCLVVAAVVIGVLASPVYEMISIRIERQMLEDISPHVPWSRMVRVMAGEVAKALIVVLVPLAMLFIPGVNMLSGVVAAFLLGWDFYDYPLARRGWTFQQRLGFVWSEFWTVLGFGVWLAIPVAQIFLIPMAVAGGTILNLEALQRRGLVSLKTNK